MPTTYNADNETCTNPNFFNMTENPSIWKNYSNAALQFLTGTVGFYSTLYYFQVFKRFVLSVPFYNSHFLLCLGCRLILEPVGSTISEESNLGPTQQLTRKFPEFRQIYLSIKKILLEVNTCLLYQPHK